MEWFSQSALCIDRCVRGGDGDSTGPCRPLAVGVFMDAPAEEVRRVVEGAGLDLVQLHGSEGYKACAREVCGVPALRVVHVPSPADTDAASGEKKEGEEGGSRAAAMLAEMEAGPASAYAVLLDTKLKGKRDGQGGVTFDWRVAADLQSAVSFGPLSSLL